MIAAPLRMSKRPSFVRVGTLTKRTCVSLVPNCGELMSRDIEIKPQALKIM